MEILFLIGAGLIFYAATRLNAFKDSYSIKFISTAIDNKRSASTFYSVLYFKMKIAVTNKTDLTGTLKNGFIDVYYKDNLIGSIDITEPSQIKANDITNIEIPVAIKTTKIIAEGKNIFEAIKQNYLELKIKGLLNFNLGKFNFNTIYPVSFHAAQA